MCRIPQTMTLAVMPVSPRRPSSPARTASRMAVGRSPLRVWSTGENRARGSARSPAASIASPYAARWERVLGLEDRERHVERGQVVLERLADLAHVDGLREPLGRLGGQLHPLALREVQDGREAERAVEVTVRSVFGRARAAPGHGRGGRRSDGHARIIRRRPAPAGLPRGLRDPAGREPPATRSSDVGRSPWSPWRSPSPCSRPGRIPARTNPGPSAAGIDASATAAVPEPSVPAEPVAPPAALHAPRRRRRHRRSARRSASCSRAGAGRVATRAGSARTLQPGRALVLGIVGAPASAPAITSPSRWASRWARRRSSGPVRASSLLVDGGVEHYTEDEDEFYVVTSRNTSGSAATLGFAQARAGSASRCGAPPGAARPHVRPVRARHRVGGRHVHDAGLRAGLLLRGGDEERPVWRPVRGVLRGVHGVPRGARRRRGSSRSDEPHGHPAAHRVHEPEPARAATSSSGSVRSRTAPSASSFAR